LAPQPLPPGVTVAPTIPTLILSATVVSFGCDFDPPLARVVRRRPAAELDGDPSRAKRENLG
jgi:hypothetical protein